MDIFYSTGLKLNLLKSYTDLDGKTRPGSRIWGLRLAQMLLNVAATVAVVALLMTLRKHHLLLGKSQEKVFIWLGIMGLLTFLSVSGLALFVYATVIKTQFVWMVTTGLYNLLHCHIIVYLMVIGTNPFLKVSFLRPPYIQGNTTYTEPKFEMEKSLFHDSVTYMSLIAGLLCFAASTIHFISAFYPTPFPHTLRLQRVTPEKEKIDKTAADEDQTGREIGEDITTLDDSNTTTMDESQTPTSILV